MTEQIREETAFLQEAGQALSEAGRLAKEEERLKEEEAKTLRELKAGEKALKDEIDSTLRKRLKELTGTHDAEIAEEKDKLKKAKAQKEKAKNEGIEERIREETRPYLEDSSAKKAEMLNAFRKQKIPAYYTTRLYYALHYPHKPADLLVLLLFVGLCFIAVPCAVYFLAVPEKWQIPVVMAGIYVAAILLFGGIYIGISNATKTPPGHMEMLRMGRDTWDEIRAARKTAKRIEQNIANETDDGAYDLAVYDDEIAQITQRLNEASRKKQEALTNFETVNRNIITDELTQNARPRIEQLSSDHAVAARRLQEVSSERQTRTLAMADDYEVYLGKENMTRERLQALSDIMAEGQVRNISEAVDEYRKRQQKG